MYISHINKYADAQAIQDALDAGTLANPYVAMTSAGTIDYNSLQPTPPAPSTMGVWTEPQQNTHAFQITETDTTYWETEVKIGELLGVYSDGNYGNLDVMLNYNQGSGTWHMVLYAEEASNTPEYDFPEEVSDVWESGAMTDPDQSNAIVFVNWDGVDTFVFQRYADGAGQQLSMTTIDPPYPAGE